ncbi:MAG: DUF4364 family protein [Oscillospiraceae bacterium]|nr:DUF4364 family protein [Oscillospiraceae bacterium]
MQDAFTAGVIPGGLTDISQIKILICYIIGELERPISHEGLLEALSGKGYSNYFEAAGALSELEEAGHIELYDGRYLLSESGRGIASLLASDVALTVRERVLDYAKLICRRELALQSCKVELTQLENGWRFHGAVSDRGGEFFALEAVLPSVEAAREARDNFLDRAEEIILANLNFLTGEKQDN